MEATELAAIDPADQRGPRQGPIEQILDRISDGVYALDHEWRFTFLNRQFERTFAVRRDDLIGKDIRDVFPEGVDGEGYLEHARAREERRPVSYESRLTARGCWIETTIHPDATGMSVCFRDIDDRKRAEMALQESEERYRWLVENTTEAVWCIEFDPPVPTHLPEDEQVSRIYRDRRLVECNEGMARIYGFASAAEMKRLQLDDIMPQSEPINLGYLRRFVRSGYRVIDVESVDVTKSGKTVHAVNNLVGIVEDGQLVRAWGTSRDVTRRRIAEDALRESEERLRATYEHAHIGIVETDLAGRFLRVNARFCNITGYGRDELLGRLFTEITHPDDVARDESFFARQKSGEISSYTLEKRYIHKDGHVVWIDLSGSLVRDASGAPRYAIGTVQDITERKRAEEALRQSEEFNRRILESSRDCVKVLDLEGRVLSVNQQGQKLLKECGIAVVSNAFYLAFWHGTDRAAAEAAIGEAIRGDVGRFVGFFRMPDGRETWWDEVISPILDATGRPERLLVVSREITELKKAEEHLRLLMAELNHRVRNSLAVVQSIATQTLRRAGSLDSFAESFDGRLSALSAAHSLLTDTNWRSARLETVVWQALTAVGTSRHAIEFRGPDLALSPKQTLSLSLVLHELATNAAKYGALTAPAGRVRVHWTLEPSRRLCLEWIETGGPPVHRPAAEGFGTVLIRRTATYDLDGEVALSYAAPGLRCRIAFPWDDAPGGMAPSVC